MEKEKQYQKLEKKVEKEIKRNDLINKINWILSIENGYKQLDRVWFSSSMSNLKGDIIKEKIDCKTIYHGINYLTRQNHIYKFFDILKEFYEIKIKEMVKKGVHNIITNKISIKNTIEEIAKDTSYMEIASCIPYGNEGKEKRLRWCACFPQLEKYVDIKMAPELGLTLKNVS